MRIWIVDAFTKLPFAGNPAAVTIVEDFPSDEACLALAAEMNLSETAFVKPLGDTHFHIRWFTPQVEVALCGHATLASAHILYQEGYVTGELLYLTSLSGPLAVVKSGEALILDFPLQPTGIALDPAPFQACLGLEPGDIVGAVQANTDALVELKDERLLRELVVDPIAVSRLPHRDLILTAQASLPYDFVSRVFAPKDGIDEDPVTGSAHCKLAPYWQQKLEKTTFQAFQASKRGGEMTVEIKGDRVHLTGHAVTVLSGTLVNQRAP